MNTTTENDRTQVKKLGKLFGATFSFVYKTEEGVFMEFEFDDYLLAHGLANELIKMDIDTSVQPMADYISVVAEL